MNAILAQTVSQMFSDKLMDALFHIDLPFICLYKRAL